MNHNKLFLPYQFKDELYIWIVTTKGNYEGNLERETYMFSILQLKKTHRVPVQWAPLLNWGRQNQRTELCSSRNIFLINMRIKEAKIQFPQQDGWIELRQWQHRQWLFLGWDHFFPRVFPSLLSTWSKDCLKWTSKSIHSFKTRFQTWPRDCL